MDWNEIKVLYQKAESCLYCSSDRESWHRDEQNGYYYMWAAYHFASIADKENTDYRTYARILSMMAHEQCYKTNDYTIFHNYVEPAYHAYQKALSSGQHISSREWEDIQYCYNSFIYRQSKEVSDGELWQEQIALIKNGEKLEQYVFCFYDSKVIYFAHDENAAFMKLKYHDIIAEFQFKDIYSITICTDPIVNWIDEYYCYRDYRFEDRINFRAGDYRIQCSSISLESIEYEKDDES